MISAVINYEDNRVSIHTSRAKKVSDKFQEGFYTAVPKRGGGLTITKEYLAELHEPFFSEEIGLVVNSVKSFFDNNVREKVNSLGFIHKLGILLHGIAGTGKTNTMHFIANQMVDHKKAIVLFCNDQDSFNGATALAKMIREIQDNPIIFISDEFERFASRHESDIKNFLDGKESVDNMLFLAATNYIDKVPETIKNRPSRFRIVQEVKGIQDKKTMEEILTKISKKINPSLMTKKEIKQEISNLTSTTIDELKHICLNKLTSSFVKVRDERVSVGFKVNDDSDNKNDIRKIDPRELFENHIEWGVSEDDSLDINQNSNI